MNVVHISIKIFFKTLIKRLIFSFVLNIYYQILNIKNKRVPSIKKFPNNIL